MNAQDYLTLGEKNLKLYTQSKSFILTLMYISCGKFEFLFQRYEESGLYRRKVKAQQLWFAVIESQIETGTPYILYKDACNRKSNQQNLGTIKCSNLCTEIVEYSSPEEVIISYC